MSTILGMYTGDFADSSSAAVCQQSLRGNIQQRNNIMTSCSLLLIVNVNIQIYGASRAEQHIPEDASPRKIYIRVALGLRAQRAR